jgi:hypothetical protein
MGITANPIVVFDPLATDIDGSELRPSMGSVLRRLAFRSLQRGLGAVSGKTGNFRGTENSFGRRFARPVFVIGGLNDKDEIRVLRNNKPLFAENGSTCIARGRALSHAKAARSSGGSTGIRPALDRDPELHVGWAL